MTDTVAARVVDAAVVEGEMTTVMVVAIIVVTTEEMVKRSI